MLSLAISLSPALSLPLSPNVDLMSPSPRSLTALVYNVHTYINAAAVAVVDVDVDVASSLTLPKAVARSKATSAAATTATSAFLG